LRYFLPMADLDATRFLAWLDDYERLWRTGGTDGLPSLFADDAQYLSSPVEQPVVGLEAIATLWDAQRDGPDDVFTMTREVVAITDSTGVARVVVRYGDPLEQEYIDLWVVRFDDSDRAVHFEEWPFWPGKPYTAHARTEPAVLHASAVDADRYVEWVRSQRLSAGVYRLPTGAVDDQTPHTEDEVYVVTRGAASLDIEGVVTPVRPGSMAFVPERAEHRFVDISEDFETVVVFAPPEIEA
jgi:mannose-6-phosphate isomerase-like protein (cupin superfamily)